ncbi:MAG: radical SAM protein [Planctomycetes bacterium]|nr:radical SAM protein [Planctomycetota bacterium]
MLDQFGRNVFSMRISVTDRCNMRCFYCAHGDVIQAKPKSEILTFEEIEEVCTAATQVGIDSFRFTGGEPLVRADCVELIEKIGKLPGVRRLGLSTNASALAPHLERLYAAGVRNINVSLDSLHSDKFAQITRGGKLRQTWDGVMAAVNFKGPDGGRFNLKLNCVMLRGFNDAELPDIAALTVQHPMSVRFIEFMPIGGWERETALKHMEHNIAEGADDEFAAYGGHAAATAFLNKTPQEQMYSIEEMKASLRKRYDLDETPGIGPDGAGPARYFQIKGAKGFIGVISPVFNPFCENCNRIRLTSDGRIKSCLLHDEKYYVKKLLRDPGYTRDKLVAVLKEAIWHKPEKHEFSRNFDMSTIGG